jgi:hypothetical protein
MPGLLRGVVRTAAIAGTATAVSGRVQRRQAERFAGRDAQIYADREEAYEQQVAPQQVETQPVETQPAGPSSLEQLQTLGELKAQGVLTEEEFAAEKAKILNR